MSEKTINMGILRSVALEMMLEGGKILFVRIIPEVSLSKEAKIISVRSPPVMTNLFSFLNTGFCRNTLADQAPMMIFFTTRFSPPSPVMTLANNRSAR